MPILPVATARSIQIPTILLNVAGESSLFAFIIAYVSPDKVTMSIEKNATIGFLPQETAAAGDETVLELALGVSRALLQAQKVIKEHPPSLSYGAASESD